MKANKSNTAYKKLIILIIILKIILSVDIELDKNSIYNFDMEELEKEIIPSEKLEDANEKHNQRLNMVILNMKYEHLSKQTSLKYMSKIDILSPSWFTLIKDRSKKDELYLKIDGHNNYKADFINNIKYDYNKIKIYPRLSCDNNFRFLSDQTGFFTEKSIAKFADDIVKRTKYYKIDGFYFDCLELQINDEFKNIYIKLISQVGSALKESGKGLILSVHPPSEKITHFINNETLLEISDYIELFVLNIGEYNKYSKRPVNYYNSPFYWLVNSINVYSLNSNSLHQKFILNIPFHGISYLIKENERADINTIDSATFFTIIINGKSKGGLSHRWDEYGKEHLIHVVDSNKDVYLSYPTRRFFNERLKFINDYDFAGVCINELMQGFEDFMDIF